MRAYHFVGDTLRDGRPIPPDGEWLVHEGPIVICESGLHASRHPFDTLQCAPGNTLCVVECEDVVAEQDDKLVCRRRMIVKRADATDMLRTFARQCALDVIHMWDAPQVVRDYLTTGDETLRAAAMAAADAAARAAAMDAAMAAAWDAAMDAAMAAADAAARAAAMDAARAAARAAAMAAAWDAARAAAWDAAWDAAMDAQRKRFADMVNDLLED